MQFEHYFNLFILGGGTYFLKLLIRKLINHKLFENVFSYKFQFYTKRILYGFLILNLTSIIFPSIYIHFVIDLLLFAAFELYFEFLEYMLWEITKFFRKEKMVEILGTKIPDDEMTDEEWNDSRNFQIRLWVSSFVITIILLAIMYIYNIYTFTQ